MRRIIYVLISVLLLLDIGYSWLQHSHNVLDGDMPGIILPASWYSEVLQDPFAIEALLKGKEYAAPNRFFCHWGMSKYFKTLPILFQKITDPINSVYLSCALAKTGIQVFLIWIIASLISGTKNIFNKELLLIAFLVTPFFQTNGYIISIGVIESSPTFFFFYTLPFALLLLFFYPFYDYLFLGKELKIKFLKFLFLLALCTILPLSSPMIPALALLACPLIIFKIGIEYFKQLSSNSFKNKIAETFKFIPTEMKLLFGSMCFMSLYSLYIGTYNIENSSSDIPMLERYARLPKGLHRMYTSQLAFYFIAFPLLVNSIMIKRFDKEKFKVFKTYLKWAGIFTLLYILLIPLGGFRRYRPLMLRHDIMIPISIILFYLYAWSTYTLLKLLPQKTKYYYISMIGIVALFFTYSDEPQFDKNKCQKETFMEIVNSDEEIIHLKNKCDILNWGEIKYPESSQYSSRLLKTWRIIDKEKVFVQK